MSICLTSDQYTVRVNEVTDRTTVRIRENYRDIKELGRVSVSIRIMSEKLVIHRILGKVLRKVWF